MSFNVKIYFSYKEPIPDDSRSSLVYMFTCAICSSSHIGKPCCHFKMRNEGYIKKE